ncbi:hypothetical protein [Streptomyces longhuiensis]|uniref:hypothetical protein n=1 Tax=Streptomyces longhuiensis TaxID=2880933 RepID=UPI001D0BE3CF|nr:hypothetical protein [Streptomyces longhuiensis]UDM00076.1 hypothetical protein LGI35_18210 [Streptomyces longhuiensis]
MNKYTVESPVRDFTGESVGVHFHKGTGSVDDATKDGRAAIEYFRRQGYALTPVDADVDAVAVQVEDDDPFDPAEHDAPEVLAYLDAHADDADEVTRILEAEQAGKARKTILARGEQKQEAGK